MCRFICAETDACGPLNGNSVLIEPCFSLHIASAEFVFFGKYAQRFRTDQRTVTLLVATAEHMKRAEARYRREEQKTDRYVPISQTTVGVLYT